MPSPRGLRALSRLSRAGGAALVLTGTSVLAASAFIAGSGVPTAGAVDCSVTTLPANPLAPVEPCTTSTTATPGATTTSVFMLPPGATVSTEVTTEPITAPPSTEASTEAAILPVETVPTLPTVAVTAPASGVLGETLPRTGSGNAGDMALGGGAAVVAGLALVISASRRRARAS